MEFLLQCMKVKSESEVAQSFPTLRDPTDCSLPGSSVHGFSRQEYWSGVPLPSPLFLFPILKKHKTSGSVAVRVLAWCRPSLSNPPPGLAIIVAGLERGLQLSQGLSCPLSAP